MIAAEYEKEGDKITNIWLWFTNNYVTDNKMIMFISSTLCFESKW